MKNPTLTRLEISKSIHRETGLTQTESSALLESILNHVSSALLRGEDVKLAGFGRFSTQHKKSRTGRNPKTGQAVPVATRRVIVFKASEKLKDRVAAGCRK